MKSVRKINYEKLAEELFEELTQSGIEFWPSVIRNKLREFPPPASDEERDEFWRSLANIARHNSIYFDELSLLLPPLRGVESKKGGEE